MLIYPTDMNPVEAGKALDDKTLSVSCAAIAQLLSSALYIRNVWGHSLYRPCEEEADFAKWAAYSRNNFRWLRHYGEACCVEFTWRRKKDGEPDQENPSRLIIGNAWDIFKGTTPRLS